MFEFHREPHIPLLTVTRTGFWTLETVKAYETAMRHEMALLRQQGPAASCIIDIRWKGAQSVEVAEALRAMIGRLGPLIASRTAVVADAGLAKLQAARVADSNARVFSSMALAREWLLGEPQTAPLGQNNGETSLPSRARQG